MAAPWRGGGANDGWNDPPMFSFNNAATSTQGHSPHRTQLNKRVAYPLSQRSDGAPVPPGNTNSSGIMLLSPKSEATNLSPIQILPPTSSTSVHPPVPLLVPNMSPPIDTSALPPSFASAAKDPFKSETLPELLERLELDSGDSLRKYTKRIFHETVDRLKESIQGRSREDVQQRLGVLDDQWREDKISEGAKVKLGCLASAIQNDDLKCADSLHLSLMVDHISEVSQWMVGVKRLINELKLMQPPPLQPSKAGEEKRTLFTPMSENNLSCTDASVSSPSSTASPIVDQTSLESDAGVQPGPKEEQIDNESPQSQSADGDTDCPKDASDENS